MHVWCRIVSHILCHVIISVKDNPFLIFICKFCRLQITCMTNMMMRIITAYTQEQHTLTAKMENFHGLMPVLGLVLVLDLAFVLESALESAYSLNHTKVPPANSEDGYSKLLKLSSFVYYLPLDPKTANLSLAIFILA